MNKTSYRVSKHGKEVYGIFNSISSYYTINTSDIRSP